MAVFSFVQSKSAEDSVGGVNTIGLTLTQNPTVNNIVTIGTLFYDATSVTRALTSVVDNSGNAYTISASSRNDSSAGQAMMAYLSPVPSNAGKVITATFNATTTVSAIWGIEFAHSTPLAIFTSGLSGQGDSYTGDLPIYNPLVPEELVVSTVAVWGLITGVISPAVSGDDHFGNNTSYQLNVTGATDTRLLMYRSGPSPATFYSAMIGFRGSAGISIRRYLAPIPRSFYFSNHKIGTF